MMSENFMKLRKSKSTLLGIYDLYSNFDRQSWICCKYDSIFTSKRHLYIFSNVTSVNNLIYQSIEPKMQDGNED